MRRVIKWAVVAGLVGVGMFIGTPRLRSAGGEWCVSTRFVLVCNVDVADVTTFGAEAGCTTDSDCAAKFGGDGSPEPVVVLR